MAPSEADGSWEFDMIPVIGNHIVKLGNGEDMEQKFNRLFIFYKQVLSRTGFDKYKTIDVRYAGQVVGGKSENPKVDSVQLRKNVENLLQQIKKDGNGYASRSRHRRDHKAQPSFSKNLMK